MEEGSNVEETMVDGLKKPVNATRQRDRDKKVDFVSFIALVINKVEIEGNRHRCEGFNSTGITRNPVDECSILTDPCACIGM